MYYGDYEMIGGDQLPKQTSGYQPSTNPYTNLNTSYNSPSVGGDLPEDFNWEDFASTSENSSQSTTGPPDWMKEWSKSWFPNFVNSLLPAWNSWNSKVNNFSGIESTQGNNTTQLQNLLAQLKGEFNQGATGMKNEFNENTKGMSDYIEKARRLMPQQYAEEMNLYNQRATQPVLNNMSSRGILNSSVTGGALSDVLRDTQAKQSDLVKQSDLWAANQNYDLNKYISDQILGINKYTTDQNLGINKYGTDKQSELSRYFTDKYLGQLEEGRKGAFTSRESSKQMIPALMNALRESQSSGTGSSFGGLLELLMSAFQ